MTVEPPVSRFIELFLDPRQQDALIVEIARPLGLQKLYEGLIVREAKRL